MKTVIRSSLVALAMAGASSAATLSLVTNTNAEEVTGGGNDTIGEIHAGQTLYVGIPYAAGAWASTEATDYFEVSTFLLGIGGTSTVSFSFHTAIDSGTELSAINQLSGIITTGTANVQAAVSGSPMDPGNTAIASVSAQIDYADLTGNPFASISNGVLWLGIKNTGSNTVAYYAGSQLGFPAPTYSFGGPFDTEAGSLVEDTYIYDSSDQFVSGNQNVHPYLNVTAVTIPVPEPAAAALGAFGGLMLLRRRRIG